MKVTDGTITLIKNQIAEHKLEEKFGLPFSNSKKDMFKLIELAKQQAILDKSEPYVFQYLYMLFTLVGRFER